MKRLILRIRLVRRTEERSIWRWIGLALRLAAVLIAIARAASIGG